MKELYIYYGELQTFSTYFLINHAENNFSNQTFRCAGFCI